MNVLFILGIIIAFVLLVVFIAIFKGDSGSNNKPSDNNHTHQNTTTYTPPVEPEIPIMSAHARDRMYQRLGNASEELMNKAFKYGKTSSNSTGDLKAKLEDAENKYEEETIAKYYNGAIYIFAKDDHVLKTVYKYNVNYYVN